LILEHLPPSCPDFFALARPLEKIKDDSDQAFWEKSVSRLITPGKGLESRSVVIMVCNDEIIPIKERTETVTDTSDLEESIIPSDICSM